MKKTKDNFSEGSSNYKKYRPTYPTELYNYLFRYVSNFNKAWDCGTGNGQVADVLSHRFNHVVATDLSEEQLRQVSVKPNVDYKVQKAEDAFLDNDLKFDLITVAQAAHWFDLPKFFDNAYEVLHDNGILAIWGYGLIRSSDTKFNQALDHFDKNIIGPYWDIERKHIDERYHRMKHTSLDMIDLNDTYFIEANWKSSRLKAYLRTWSAVRHYKKTNNDDPVDLLFKQYDLLNYIDETTLHFPIFIKLFKKKTC